ncbi:hypothetical protein DL98DRAFT_124739 [Cadophora sp. DSE1049]|nr:hypothetical protein DL98DRAFT_124739 [Cadophora sp. DSE1049]
MTAQLCLLPHTDTILVNILFLEKPIAFVDVHGTVYISIGQLLGCRTAGHVAMVLGHEIGHALGRHSQEMGWLEVTRAYIGYIEAAWEKKVPFTQPTTTTTPSSMAEKHALQRHNELEADYISLGKCLAKCLHGDVERHSE